MSTCRLKAVETHVVGFNTLRFFYDQEVASRIGKDSIDVDPQAVVMGEVFLLAGGGHQPNMPTLRQLLTDFLPEDTKDAILQKFTLLTYDILDSANIPDGVLKVRPIGGYAIAIDRMELKMG